MVEGRQEGEQLLESCVGLLDRQAVLFQGSHHIGSGLPVSSVDGHGKSRGYAHGRDKNVHIRLLFLQFLEEFESKSIIGKRQIASLRVFRAIYRRMRIRIVVGGIAVA